MFANGVKPDSDAALIGGSMLTLPLSGVDVDLHWLVMVITDRFGDGNATHWTDIDGSTVAEYPKNGGNFVERDIRADHIDALMSEYILMQGAS